jgi:spermidine synthase
MARLAAIGALSLAAQFVLLREVAVAFYGVELLYLLGLAVWLVGTALGTTLAARRRALSPALVAWGFAAIAPALAAGVVGLRGAGTWLHGVRGAYLPLGQQLAVLAAALGPTAVVFGVLFQWAARSLVVRGDTLARAYAVESAGALAGGLAAAALVRAGVQTFAVALGTAVAAMIVALGPMAARGRRGAWGALAAIVGAVAALGRAAPGLDHRLTQWSQPELVEARDSPYARIAVTRRGEQVAVFENNALAFDTESPEAQRFAHLVLLHHPAPARVLVLGGGPAGLVAAALAHPVRVVDDVEVDRVVVELVARHAPGMLGERPGVARLLVGEPRRVLRRADSYDVVLLGVPEPDSGAANRFYTREFFALVAAHLAPGGLVGLRLRISETLWTPAELRRLAAIERALRAVFADLVVLPGPEVVLVASQTPLPRDADTLAARLAARHLASPVVTPAYLRYLFRTDRGAALAEALAHATASPNSDIRPVCYQEAAIIWLGKFWLPISRLDPSLFRLNGDAPRDRWGRSIPLLLWLAIVIVCRRPAARRRRLVAFVAGAAGMVLETVWLLHYQLTQGVLFEDLAVLVSAFMAGLAAGAFAARRLAWARERALVVRAPRALGASLLAALAALAAVSAALVRAAWASDLVAAGGMLAATGALVAALFAYASADEVRDQAVVIAPLYAADLAGGCAGALVATLLLIPLAGLAATAGWTATFVLVTILAIR